MVFVNIKKLTFLLNVNYAYSYAVLEEKIHNYIAM